MGTKFDSSKDNSTETTTVFGVENKDIVETVNDLYEKLQEPCIPVHSPEPLNAKKK